MRIGYLQGGSRMEIQSVLWAVAQELIASGHRLAGMVEHNEAPVFHDKRDSRLRDVAGDASCCLFQDLGRNSRACSLDPSAIAQACGLIEASIAPELDLVVLSKFGKVEADGGGFRTAIGKAMLLDIPILTSVNPLFDASWQEFTCGLATRLPIDMAAVRAWWCDGAATEASAGASRMNARV